MISHIGAMSLLSKPGCGYLGPHSIPLTTRPLAADSPLSFIKHWPAFVRSNDLAHPLLTSGMRSCAALAVINRPAGWHYLAHIDDGTSAVEMAAHVRADLTIVGSKFYLLPGDSPYTHGTVGCILRGLDLVQPGLWRAVQFVHFNGAIDSHDAGIVSADGALWQTDINPHYERNAAAATSIRTRHMQLPAEDLSRDAGEMPRGD